MEILRDWLPFAKTPILNSENFLNNCLTCHPFGKVTRDALHAAPTKPPSQEIKTISSLVEKFTVGRQNINSNGITQTNSFNLKNTFNRHHTSNRHQACTRNRSFTVEMKHERFTPCELTKNNYTYYHTEKMAPRSFDNYSEHRTISSEITITPTMKISSTRVISANNITMTTNYEQSDVIVVPPRRKRRANRKQYSDSSTDISLETNLNLEKRKNFRNTELNNLDQQQSFTTSCYDSINSTKSKSLNVSHSTINKNNNKSGCSNVDVVSGILNLNITNNHSENENTVENNYFDYNLNNKKQEDIVTQENSQLVGYCQNKVYYKDNDNDLYENCIHCGKNRNIYEYGGEIDEVLVCESIVTFEQQPISLPTPTSPPPKDSTYRKFCTDSLYHDTVREDEVLNSSFESQFEQINRLKPQTGLISISPFTKFRIRKQKRPRRGSLIKDLGLLPSVHHRATSIQTSQTEKAPTTTTKTKTKTISEGFCNPKSFTTLSPSAGGSEHNMNNICDSKDRTFSFSEPRKKNSLCRDK